MGIDYSVFMSNAPITEEPYINSVTGAIEYMRIRAELPHETVAAVANLLTPEHIHVTVQDVREYIIADEIYRYAPSDYEDLPEGTLTDYEMFKIIHDNPKWSVIDSIWHPGSAGIALGRRFGASQILAEAGCEDAHEYIGSFKNAEAVMDCIEASLTARWNIEFNDAVRIAQQISQMGFDSINWG